VIRALVLVNSDGHVCRKSIIGMPESVLLHPGIQEFCGETLLMFTLKQMPAGMKASELIDLSRKSLVAETDDKLATMAANLEEKEDVGDITVLANRSTLNALDYLGMAYELDIISPNDAELPQTLTSGRIQLDKDIVDGKYTLRRYAQSVAQSSDIQIAEAIAGMETFFNEKETMDARDKKAVDNIASKIAMINAAEERDRRRRSDIDSYDDGCDSDTDEELDIDEELDSLWDANTEMANQIVEVAKQIGEAASIINSVQSKFIIFVEDMNKKAELDKKMAENINAVNGRVNLVNGDIENLRNQLGNAIAESIQKPKARLWPIYTISISALVVGLINLLL